MFLIETMNRSWIRESALKESKHPKKTPTLEQLTDMTDEDCLAVLEKLWFEDTRTYETREETAEAAKEIIKYYADGGSSDSVPFSYTGMIDMVKEIQTILKNNGY